MYDENHEHWEDDESATSSPQQQQIQKLFAELELKAKKAMEYLVTEGFLEPTDTPGEYKYTPEGLVLAQQQYKQMRENGLI
jgi:predicted transcriptional regulator